MILREYRIQYTQTHYYPSEIISLKVECNNKVFYKYYNNYTNHFPSKSSSSDINILTFEDIKTIETLPIVIFSQLNNNVKNSQQNSYIHSAIRFDINTASTKELEEGYKAFGILLQNLKEDGGITVEIINL